MGFSFSNLVKNLSEGIHRTKCKFGHNNKKWETCGNCGKLGTVFLNVKALKMI